MVPRHYFLKRTRKIPSKGERRVLFPEPEGKGKGFSQASKEPSKDEVFRAPEAMEIAFPSDARPFLSWLSVATVLGILSAFLILGSLVVWQGGMALKDELLGQTQAAASSLQTAVEKATNKDFKEALVNFRLARDNFDGAAKKLFAFGQGNFYLVNLSIYSPRLLPVERALLAGYHLANSGIQLSLAAQSLSSLLTAEETVGKDIPRRLSELLEANQDKLILADKEAQQAVRLLSGIKGEALGAAYAATLSEAYRQAVLLSEVTGSFRSLSVALPRALGTPLPQSYLILFQNNNELRPSGGFIGSLAFLRLYQAEIDYLDVRDVYEVDGKIPPGSMPLPKPLEEIAWTGHLGIRDANWSADFDENARNIAALYEKSGGTTVDGIIAVTPEVLKDALRILGPVYLPERELFLTAANVIDTFQEEIELRGRFTEEPKAILLEAAPLVLEKLFAANEEQMGRLGEALYGRLMGKDILLYSFDKNIQSIIGDFGWGGEIPALGEREDYLQIVKANLGANKTSQQVIEEIEHLASVDEEGKVIDNLKLTYFHQGQPGTPPLAGPNKSYIRILVPPGSRLKEMQGFDEGTQVDIYQENGRTVFGFWLTIDPGEVKNIKLSYTLPLILKPDRADRYLLTIQKQPGSNTTTLRSLLHLPGESQVVGDKDSLSYQTLYAGPLGQDLTLSSVFRGK